MSAALLESSLATVTFGALRSMRTLLESVVAVLFDVAPRALPEGSFSETISKDTEFTSTASPSSGTLTA